MFPKIDVDIRQNFNIKKRVIRYIFSGSKAGEKTENF